MNQGKYISSQLTDFLPKVKLQAANEVGIFLKRHARTKHPLYVLGGLAGYFVGGGGVGIGHYLHNMGEITALVALAAHGNGRHVRAIGFENDARKGDVGQHRGQVRLLKGKHTANAQHEFVELQEGIGLAFVTRKAMENTAWQFFFVLFDDVHHLVLPLSAMYHQGQLVFGRPAHLLFEGFELLLFELATPIKV